MESAGSRQLVVNDDLQSSAPIIAASIPILTGKNQSPLTKLRRRLHKTCVAVLELQKHLSEARPKGFKKIEKNIIEFFSTASDSQTKLNAELAHLLKQIDPTEKLDE